MDRIVAIKLMLVLPVASATAGIRNYCDYLGSIRAIVNTDGEVGVNLAPNIIFRNIVSNNPGKIIKGNFYKFHELVKQ